jgi:hypothetical protein
VEAEYTVTEAEHTVTEAEYTVTEAEHTVTEAEHTVVEGWRTVRTAELLVYCDRWRRQTCSPSFGGCPGAWMSFDYGGGWRQCTEGRRNGEDSRDAGLCNSAN